jgi:putative hemolysin
MNTPATSRYEVRLARDRKEVEAAQKLRYRVFYTEMGALPSSPMTAQRRDFDDFDRVCDHLVVIDHLRDGDSPWVVGTYRMLRKAVAQKQFGFYSESEFDLHELLSYPGECMEVGRSCVESESRRGVVIQLLWRGIAEYINQHDIQLLFGCASFPGTDSEALASPLSYLYHNHLAPKGLRPRAKNDLCVDMNNQPIDNNNTAGNLPPLIKGYLRVGAYVGDGAVIDRQFNTTDICVVVKTDNITRRYQRHYRTGSMAA